MNFTLAILGFLPAVFHSTFDLSIPSTSKNLTDSFYILVRIDYPENFSSDLQKNPFFIQQLITDFKQREKKQNKIFALSTKRDSATAYDLVLNFTFYDLKISEEKNDQSMRLATMKKIQTVFDKEAEQHKRQDVDYSADVNHVKRSIECSVTVAMNITNNVDGPILSSKIVNGKYRWENEYVTYSGDKEALTDQELQLSKSRNQNTPSGSGLYRELLKNVFKELNPALDDFFQFKKGF